MEMEGNLRSTSSYNLAWAQQVSTSYVRNEERHSGKLTTLNRLVILRTPSPFAIVCFFLASLYRLH